MQEDFEKLNEDQRKGKYSLGKIESHFQMFELTLAPKSNPLLAVKELHTLRQGSITSGEFHAQIT